MAVSKEELARIGRNTIAATTEAVSYARTYESANEWFADKDVIIETMDKMLQVIKAQHTRLLELWPDE